VQNGKAANQAGLIAGLMKFRAGSTTACCFEWNECDRADVFE